MLNYWLIVFVMGIMFVVIVCMFVLLFVCLFWYGEDDFMLLFVLMVVIFVVGLLLCFGFWVDKNFGVCEVFFIVVFGWVGIFVVLMLFFVLYGVILLFIDVFFEMILGYMMMGVIILMDIEVLFYGLFLWCS